MPVAPSGLSSAAETISTEKTGADAGTVIVNGVSASIAETNASACGLVLDLPDGACPLTQTDDLAMWMIEYEDGGKLLVSVDRHDWSGTDVDIAEYALSLIEAAASVVEGAVVDVGAWGTYGQVEAYGCGYASADRATYSITADLGGGTSVRMLLGYSGSDVVGVQSGAVADILASLRFSDGVIAEKNKHDPVLYYDVLGLLELPGSQIVEVLEDYWWFDYAEGPQNRGWLNQYKGPFCAGMCFVLFAAAGDTMGGNIETGRHAGVSASRDMLAEDAELTGMEVRWIDMPPTSVDDLSATLQDMQDECGLKDTLGEGYTVCAGSDGASAWMRVGACQIRGRDAYWWIEVVSPGEHEVGGVGLGAYLLRGGPGGDYASYDALVEELFGR